MDTESLLTIPAPRIRPARQADLETIGAIYADAVENTVATFDYAPRSDAAQKAWFDARTAGGWPVLVAEVDGRVVGYGTYGPFRAFDAYAYTVEHSVYVDGTVRRHGLGSALLSALIASAREQRHHALIGVIDGDNIPSILLHQRHGFAEVGRLPEVGWKFGTWRSVVVMQRFLDGVSAPRPPDPLAGKGPQAAL